MKLIVNADDFGESVDVNNNIIKCHQEGILTSTTLLAAGKAFEDAVVISKSNPKLGIGAHLAIDGPFNISKNHASLINPVTGHFYEGSEVVRKIRKGVFVHKELVAEYSTQIEKILDSGIHITHLDHHHHLHLYFPVLNAMIAVAHKFNIQYIRPQRILLPTQTSLSKKIYRRIHHSYLKKRHKTIDGYTGLFSSDQNVMRLRFQSILQAKEDVIELVVHPLIDNGEIDFLVDTETINSSHTLLINYGDLG